MGWFHVISGNLASWQSIWKGGKNEKWLPSPGYRQQKAQDGEVFPEQQPSTPGMWVSCQEVERSEVGVRLRKACSWAREMFIHSFIYSTYVP